MFHADVANFSLGKKNFNHARDNVERWLGKQVDKLNGCQDVITPQIICSLFSRLTEIAFDLYLTDPRITLNTQFNIIFGVYYNTSLLLLCKIVLVRLIMK